MRMVWKTLWKLAGKCGEAFGLPAKYLERALHSIGR
jgi:hypothetical protein